MHFDDFYGQSAVVQRLRAQIQDGAIVHAFLFTGPHGCGKKTLARICAAAWLCTGQNKPCGVCGSCKRIMHASHPDYLQIITDKAELSVENAESLVAQLAMHPYEGAHRSVLILSPMSIRVQNYMLKSFEEPPEGTAFFIVADQKSQLLPTVLSRVQLVQLGPLNPQLCIDALVRRGIAPARAAELTQLSGGALGRALELDNDQEYFQLRQQAFALLAPLMASGLSQRANLFSALKRSDCIVMLTCACEILADMMRVKTGGSPLSKDQLQWLESHSAVLDEKALCALTDAALLAIEMLRHNSSVTNALETFLFVLVKETKGWQS